MPSFEEIFSRENVFLAWHNFARGKKYKEDVAEFAVDLVHNLSSLRNDLISGKYSHGGYRHFKISDPKPRDIHKAEVRDRVVHHVLYNTLYPYFDRKFIFDSYSCRRNKGTHKALKRFQEFTRKESGIYRKRIWILKCDIKKCFASVDHQILKSILRREITCEKTMAIIDSIIDSFYSGEAGLGIPLGNLTSQLFVNIYLHEFDQYMKRKLKVKKYIRYADDFVIISDNRDFLLSLIPQIGEFLKKRLHFELHDKKISLKAFSAGIDFLGWVHFPRYSVLRTVTKKRMFRNLKNSRNNSAFPSHLDSYFGLLKYGNAWYLETEIMALYDNK